MALSYGSPFALAIGGALARYACFRPDEAATLMFFSAFSSGTGTARVRHPCDYDATERRRWPREGCFEFAWDWSTLGAYLDEADFTSSRAARNLRRVRELALVRICTQTVYVSRNISVLRSHYARAPPDVSPP